MRLRGAVESQKSLKATVAPGFLSTHNRSEAQSASADTQRGEIENIHDRKIDQRSHEDHIGAVGREAHDLLSSIERQTPQVCEMRANAVTSEENFFDGVAIEPTGV